MTVHFLKYNETSLYHNHEEPQFFPQQAGSFSYQYLKS